MVVAFVEAVVVLPDATLVVSHRCRSGLVRCPFAFQPQPFAVVVALLMFWLVARSQMWRPLQVVVSLLLVMLEMKKPPLQTPMAFFEQAVLMPFDPRISSKDYACQEQQPPQAEVGFVVLFVVLLHPHRRLWTALWQLHGQLSWKAICKNKKKIIEKKKFWLYRFAFLGCSCTSGSGECHRAKSGGLSGWTVMLSDGDHICIGTFSNFSMPMLAFGPSGSYENMHNKKKFSKKELTVWTV